jgi:tetratricopeptide (TPR) repeat protein
MTPRGWPGWAFPACCAAAVAVLLAAYSDSFQNTFHFDDSHVVENNLYIRSLNNVPRFFRDASTFSSFPANATYRPLVTATLALDYWIGGGLQPKQFHVSQIAMLIALGAMVFGLFLRLFDMAGVYWWNRYAALLGALFFCVHTTGTETMNLIHARSELMSVMGVVGSFLVYLYLPRSRGVYLYLLPMIVGALAKNQAVVFAPLFLLYLLLFEQELSAPDLLSAQSWRKVGAALWKALPAFVIAIATLAFVERMNASAATYGGGGRLAYFQTQLFVWLHYVRLFVLPIGLTADTDWRLISNWYDTRVIAGACFTLLMLALIWYASRRRSLRPVAFGVSWFFLALLPASSIVPLAEVANEHRVFFPYVGLTLAAVWGAGLALQRWSEARPTLRPAMTIAACGVAALLVAGNAIGAYERNRIWQSEETLWRDVAAKSPENGRGLMNYGLTLMARGSFVEAKDLFDRALRYTPNYASLEVNLGIVNDSLGNPVVAEQHFARALELEPDYPASHTFYARWLVQRGRTAEAIPHLKRAISLSPASLDARYQLLGAYAKAGQTAELKALAAETLALAPGDAEVNRYLSTSGVEAIQQTPPPASHAEPADSLLNTSLQLYQAGDYQGSIDAAKKALALNPNLAEAHNNIAAAHASLRQWDEAIQAAKEALRLKPDFPLARNNLAWAEGEKRKTNK